MKWVKQGVIDVPESNGDWMVSHAQFPIADRIDENRLRIYFGTRSARTQTVTTYVEVEADDPRRILYRHDRPVLGLGELGCFDDGGALPAWIVDHAGKKYLYYVGWNAGVTVSYRNSIGLAVSEDGGKTFHRMFKGPIVDRSPSEPHFCSSPCVLRDDQGWRMWYLNGTRWITVDGRPEPVYHLKYAESEDGIEWRRDGTVAIELSPEEEGGIARPSVLREDGMYRMWYSRRGIRDYRSDPARSYRIGYAESRDGVHWDRKDDEAGITVSEEGWDSKMIEFPYVYLHRGKKHLLYNGNGFGASGIGWAIGDED